MSANIVNKYKAMNSFWKAFLLIVAILNHTNAQKALVLDSFVSSIIDKRCNYHNLDYDYLGLFSENNSYASFFEQAPSYVQLPTNVSTSFNLSMFLAQNPGNYNAIVAPFSPFIASVAMSYNMLYYIYDYNFDINLNLMLQDLSENDAQQATNALNDNVRVAFSYFSLFQAAYQLVFNTNQDQILSNYYGSTLQFLLCDDATVAQIASSGSMAKVATPIVLPIDDYINNPDFKTACNMSAICMNGIPCSQSCAVYSIALTIRQSLNALQTTATLVVALSEANQKNYFKMFLQFSLELGLMSSNVLWIIVDYWLQPSDLIYFYGVSSPIYIISIPSFDSREIETYVCNDYVVQSVLATYNGDNLPCPISKSPSSYCTASADKSSDSSWLFYTGYLPTSLQYSVRRVDFSSLAFFESFFTTSSVSTSIYDTLPVSTYNVNALPLQVKVTVNSSAANRNSFNWAPYPHNCQQNTSYKPYNVAATGSKLLDNQSLSGLAVNALGVIFEPLLMQVADYEAAEMKLIQSTLTSHLITASSIVYYSADCSDPANIYSWCFFNASKYGFTDVNYNGVLLNATIMANGSNVPLCPLSLMAPFYDNLNLYTGFSVDVLMALRNELNFSIRIIIQNGSLSSLAKALSESSEYAITANHIIINDESDKYVDFTSASTTTGVNIIMSNLTYDPTWQVIYPFGDFVWIMILGSLVLISLTFYVIDRISKNDGKHYSLLLSFSYTYASFTQGAIDVTPKRLSARVLSMFMWFGVMLLLSSYTSAMAVVLLTPPTTPCVKGLHDLLGCRVLFNIPPDSVALQMLADPTYSNLSVNHRFSGTFDTVSPFFNSPNNLTSSNYFAYVGDSLFNRYYYAKYCSYMNISLIGQPQYTQFRAFGVPIGANYKRTIDAGLLNLSLTGKRTALADEWFPDEPTECSFPSHAKPMSYSDMAGLYIILLVGLVLAVLFLALEILMTKYKFSKLKQLAPQLEFGQVYEATVVKTSISGVFVDINAQPESFFIPYENLNLGNISLLFPHELGIRPGTMMYVKFFGIEQKTNKARLVLVKMETPSKFNSSADAMTL